MVKIVEVLVVQKRNKIVNVVGGCLGGWVGVWVGEGWLNMVRGKSKSIYCHSVIGLYHPGVEFINCLLFYADSSHPLLNF